MPKHLKKVSEEVLHSNPYWDYKHDIYEMPNGVQGEYWYADRVGTALIIPKLPDDRIVLTLQHRYLQDKQSIEFPAGGLLKDIQLLESAQRELLEETGCVGENWVKIGMFEESNGVLKCPTHVYMCDVVSQTHQQLDDSEEIEVLTRRPDEIQQMIERNEIWDGLTLAAWSLVRHYFIA